VKWYPHWVLKAAEERAAGNHVTSSGYVGALDGVRGIAIALVLTYHYSLCAQRLGFEGALLKLTNIGWCGVDLFFVLSGFLITGILYDSRNSQQYFVNFYARRVLRIFPLYYLAILFVWVLSVAWPQANILGAHGSLVWPAIFLTNVIVALEGPSAVPTALLHFWSLAIEEHFYLLWPFLVMLGSRRFLMGTAVTIIVAAFSMRAALVIQGADPSTSYFLTPMRMDALAVGAFCSLGVRGPLGISGLARPAWVVGAACALGILVLVAITQSVYPTKPAMQIIGHSMLALGFGAFIVVGLAWSPLATLLNIGVLRWLGLYSYGLYVWHYIINFIFFDTSMKGAFRIEGAIEEVIYLSAAITLAFLLAVTSYHFWERPFLRLKKHFKNRPTSLEAGPNSYRPSVGIAPKNRR
jgi:peptidoglycan/LPS O-acetylase OafA/YrhL